MNMKRNVLLILVMLVVVGNADVFAQFGKMFNVGKALQAGKDAVQAVTLSDEDIANMSKEYEMDGRK